MEYKRLGNTGTLISELCLGTMTFGGQTVESDAVKIMDRFAQEGGIFFDTANVYTGGISEEILGKWLHDHDRDDYVVATKVRFQSGNSKNSIGLGRKHILKSVEESLQRLKTDYIDLLQVHAWDPITPLEETLGTLTGLVDQGLVRYIGASNFRAWQFEKALGVSKENGFEKFVSLQPQYNLLSRSTENEIIPMAIHEDVAILPWSPLKSGVLSGKYSAEMNNPPEGTRLGDAFKSGRKTPWELNNNEHTWRVVNALNRVAKEVGKTNSQVALNWLLTRKGVTSPIIGVRTMDQLIDNLGCLGWKLTKSEIDELNQSSALHVTYPYDLWAENQQRSGRMDDLEEL
ncbi:aldo/keto reductase [Oxyplasma meridianum]|uniref:Aldo/keto reductase n=1 Tax=Oxyplasma meridianum TaxID=3073602 RepID=A0AAX4NGJ9_9ARCH